MSSSDRRSPRPSTRFHPGSPFAWQDAAPAPAAGADRRAAAARDELASRAGLLYRLGFSQADATARLVARTAWEFDPASAGGAHRRPAALSDQGIAQVVAETYARKPG